MKAWMIPVGVIAGVAAGVGIGAAAHVGSGTVTVERTSTVITIRHVPAPMVPACPELTFAVDGTAGPIFCKVDSPEAIHYYRQWLVPLMKLGPDATPSQVTSLVESWHNSTNPITCAVYDLAQHAYGWRFAINPISGVTGFNC